MPDPSARNSTGAQRAPGLWLRAGGGGGVRGVVAPHGRPMAARPRRPCGTHAYAHAGLVLRPRRVPAHPSAAADVDRVLTFRQVDQRALCRHGARRGSAIAPACGHQLLHHALRTGVRTSVHPVLPSSPCTRWQAEPDGTARAPGERGQTACIARTCDIMDPYQAITWVPPKAGAARSTTGCNWATWCPRRTPSRGSGPGGAARRWPSSAPQLLPGSRCSGRRCAGASKAWSTTTEPCSRGRPPILGFWHGRILPATVYFRGRGIVVITSRNFRRRVDCPDHPAVRLRHGSRVFDAWRATGPAGTDSRAAAGRPRRVHAGRSQGTGTCRSTRRALAGERHRAPCATVPPRSVAVLDSRELGWNAGAGAVCHGDHLPWASDEGCCPAQTPRRFAPRQPIWKSDSRVWKRGSREMQNEGARHE